MRVALPAARGHAELRDALGGTLPTTFPQATTALLKVVYRSHLRNLVQLLLPERPPYLDKYEKFFREAEETSSNMEMQSWSGDCVATSSATKLDSKP